jgi:hypothetical protein
VPQRFVQEPMPAENSNWHELTVQWTPNDSNLSYHVHSLYALLVLSSSWPNDMRTPCSLSFLLTLRNSGTFSWLSNLCVDPRFLDWRTIAWTAHWF